MPTSPRQCKMVELTNLSIHPEPTFHGKSCHPGARSRRGAFVLAALILVVINPPLQRTLAVEPPSKPGPVSKPERLTLVRRSVTQDQGAWIIDYRLRHTGKTGIILMPSELGATLEGWVSNSRVASHAVPRLARVAVSGASSGTATGDVITSTDEAQKCRERVILSVWADDGPLPESDVASLVSLGPGATAHVRLRLEHQ